MVKKERNKHVWEQSVPKARKKRTQRQTDPQKDDKQSIPLSASNQEEQFNPQINIVEQNLPIYNQDNIEDKQISDSVIQSEPDQSLRSQSADVLKTRLTIIKQVFLSDQDSDLHNRDQKFTDYRPEQSNQIRQFLFSEHSSTSNLMYIYGIPGSGKTFIVRNILNSHGWLHKTKWLNCLSILNKTSLKKAECALLPKQQRKWLLVIDQFDQIESLLRMKRFSGEFKRYLQSLLRSEFTEDRNTIKYIFISNRSYQEIDQGHISMVQQMIKCDMIIEVPFLPYAISCIIRILKERAALINSTVGQQVVPSSFIELATRRVCSATQDIRKVINFIIRSYQNIGNNIDCSSRQLKDHLSASVFQIQTYGEETIEAKIIKRMPEKPKNLFKCILMLSDQAAEEKKACLLTAIHRQGLKMEISHQSMDVLMRQWEQQGLIRVQNYSQRQKERTHNLYQLKSIKTHLSYRENRHLFY